jgi:hypothetical protein
VTRHGFIRTTALTALLLLQTSGLAAQAPVISPYDSARVSINGSHISIVYGKPSIHGRQIFGGVVPFFKVWRMGAGQATTVRTDADLEMDGAVVPRGVYTLYAIPTDAHWKLIINKQTGQWGTVYDAHLDLARLDVVPTPARAPVESLAFHMERTGPAGGTLRFEWDKIAMSVPFRVSRDSVLPSPRDSAIGIVDGARLTIDYGRPSMRGRTIFGGVVPYGTVWRAGANAATGFTTSMDLTIGGVRVPKGTYTLYILPDRKRPKLIVNKQTGQWGTVYASGKDLARIPMAQATVREAVERFTIDIVTKAVRSGVIEFRWERTVLRVPFHR